MATAVFWRVAAPAFTVLALILHVVAAWGVSAPRTSRDEVTLLQIARLLAGDDQVPELAGRGYYPGASILLVPLWWLSDDPAAIYRAALAVGIVVSMATIWPATLLVRSFGLGHWQAWTVAALGMCAATRTAQAAYVLSEIALLFFLTWAVLLGWKLTQRPSVQRAVLFGAASCTCLLVHPRALVVVVISGIWLVVLAWRSLRAAAAGLLTLAGGYLLVNEFVEQVNQRILRDGFTQVDNLTTALQNTTPLLMTGSATGQLWSQQVGTLGLVSIGLLTLVGAAVTGLRGRRLEPQAFVVLLVAAGTGASIATWSGPNFLVESPRLDVWLYSRYSDPYTHIVLLAGLAALINGLRQWVWWVNAAFAAVLVTLIFLVVMPRAPLDGYFGPSQAPGVQVFRFLLPPDSVLPNHPQTFWIAGSLVVVGSAALLPLLARYRRIGFVVLALGFGIMSVLAAPDQDRPAPEPTRSAVEQLEAATGNGPLPLQVDERCLDDASYLPLNWLAFWMSPRLVGLQEDGVSSDTIYVTCPRDDPPAEGAVRYAPDASRIFGLWLVPGPLLDSAASAGLLSD